MRNAMSIVAVVILGACASKSPPMESNRRAVIGTATEAQCDRPGVRIDAVKQMRINRSVKLSDPYSPLEVEPGRYAISVACQNPFNEMKGQCVFWGHPNEYPTYKMSLKAGVSYTFKCYEANGELVYRVSEKNL